MGFIDKGKIDHKEVGKRMRSVREHVGWNQKRLAAVVGCHEATIRAQELGRASLGREKLERLFEALEKEWQKVSAAKRGEAAKPVVAPRPVSAPTEGVPDSHWSVLEGTLVKGNTVTLCDNEQEALDLAAKVCMAGRSASLFYCQKMAYSLTARIKDAPEPLEGQLAAAHKAVGSGDGRAEVVKAEAEIAELRRMHREMCEASVSWQRKYEEAAALIAKMTKAPADKSEEDVSAAATPAPTTPHGDRLPLSDNPSEQADSPPADAA